MDKSDLNHSCRIILLDGFLQTGVVKEITDKSITISKPDGSKIEIFFAAIASIKVDAEVSE
jgi:hypothetical protein